MSNSQLCILFLIFYVQICLSEKNPLFTSSNPFKKRSNIAIVTYFAPGTTYESFLEPIVAANKRAYAKRNNYDFINAFEHEDLVNDYKNHTEMHFYPASHYYKLRLIPLLFQRYGYQWIMWSDGDAIFLNHSQRLEPHFDANYDLIFTADPPSSQQMGQIINTGHFLVKNTAWSKKFMFQAYGLSFANCYEYLGNKPPINGWLNMCKSRDKFILADQRVLQYYVSYTPKEIYGCHFKQIHFHNFNSEFPKYRPGDMVVHFPGKTMAEKVRLIKMMIDNCNYENGEIDFRKAPDLAINENAARASENEFISVNKKCQ